MRGTLGIVRTDTMPETESLWDMTKAPAHPTHDHVEGLIHTYFRSLKHMDNATFSADAVEPLLVELRRIQSKPHAITWGALVALIPVYIVGAQIIFWAGALSNRMTAQEQWRVEMDPSRAIVAQLQANQTAMQRDIEYMRSRIDAAIAQKTGQR